MVDTAQELAQELSPLEREELRAWCAGISLVDFLLWERDHHELAVEYAASSAAQRARLRKRREPGLRPRLVWCALYLLQACRALLHRSELVYNNCLDGGYRNAIRLAADIAFLRPEPYLFQWPYEPPDPTAEWCPERLRSSSTE
jgi:hypothetical protein